MVFGIGWSKFLWPSHPNSEKSECEGAEDITVGHNLFPADGKTGGYLVWGSPCARHYVTSSVIPSCLVLAIILGSYFFPSFFLRHLAQNLLFLTWHLAVIQVLEWDTSSQWGNEVLAGESLGKDSQSMAKNPELPLYCKEKPQKRDLENGSLIVTNPTKKDLNLDPFLSSWCFKSGVRLALKESLHCGGLNENARPL